VQVKCAVSWDMFISGPGVAVPPQRLARRECWEARRGSTPFTRLAPRSRALREAVPDGLWWMSAFGVGFSGPGALLVVK